MNTRITSTSLFCVALACSTIPASAAVRPEIASHLKQAEVLVRGARWGSLERQAIQEIRAAEKAPNLTDEERQAIARTKAVVFPSNSQSFQDNHPWSQITNGFGDTMAHDDIPQPPPSPH